jgi:hypothetical protein
LSGKTFRFAEKFFASARMSLTEFSFFALPPTALLPPKLSGAGPLL